MWKFPRPTKKFRSTFDDAVRQAQGSRRWQRQIAIVDGLYLLQKLGVIVEKLQVVIEVNGNLIFVHLHVSEIRIDFICADQRTAGPNVNARRAVEKLIFSLQSRGLQGLVNEANVGPSFPAK